MFELDPFLFSFSFFLLLPLYIVVVVIDGAIVVAAAAVAILPPSFIPSFFVTSLSQCVTSTS